MVDPPPPSSNSMGSSSLFESVIPNEILELIFDFFGPWGVHRLCAVCHRWRSVALLQHHLWAQSLPRLIVFHRSHNDDLDGARRGRSRAKLTAQIQQCLQRSGSQPISFRFISLRLPNQFFDRKALSSMLSPLVDECSRWCDIDILLPMDIFRDAVDRNIKLAGGVLKELRRLRLNFCPLGPDAMEASMPVTSPVVLDCFSNAPHLRYIYFNLQFMFGHNDPERRRPMKIDLPWGQLESFEYTSYCDFESYNALLEAHQDSKASSWLKVVDLLVMRVPAIPTFPFTSATLHTLHLRLGLNAVLFCSHIDKLTLPALRDLEIRGPFNGTALPVPQSQPPSATLYSTVARLIARSGCSLEKLGLDMGWSPTDDNGDQQWAGLNGILVLTPRLEELDITISRGQKGRQTLRGLCADEETDVEYLDNALLPHLQFLAFRLVDLPDPEYPELVEPGMGEDYDPWASTDLSQIFDFPALAHLIRSRTATASGEGAPPLDEVHLVLPIPAIYTLVLLERIRLACNSSIAPVSVANHRYDWKGNKQEDKILVLRRRWIPDVDPQTMEAGGDEDNDGYESRAVPRRMYPFWTWDIDGL